MTTKNELIKKIRLFCGECMGGERASVAQSVSNPSEIAGCTAPECVWFEYRFGTDPHPNASRVERGKVLVNNFHPGRENNHEKQTISDIPISPYGGR